MSFFAVASDLAAKPYSRTTSVKVVVYILDINDNRPKISGLKNISIPENVPTGFYVTVLRAFDNDKVTIMKIEKLFMKTLFIMSYFHSVEHLFS